jgi:LAO/AO transport system kinase
MARPLTLDALVEGVRAGDRRAVARAISMVENGDRRAYELVRAVYPASGGTFAIGVTGPPGVGKSTLIGAMISRARAEGRTVGVISVDPSSTFSRGAVLGDRIRLSDHFLDPGVFIRSMATRGHLGGIAEATLQAALILAASGKDLLFLETVGIGQSEIEIAQVADTVLLVLMPGSGDSVQALKAGILEIPDAISLNKSDHPQAKSMLTDVRGVLELGPKREWAPPIVLTEALRGDGVDELWEALGSHRRHLESGGRLEERRRRSLAAEVFALASGRAKQHLEQAVADDPELRRLLAEVEERELDPLTAVREILERVFRIERDGGQAGAG